MLIKLSDRRPAPRELNGGSDPDLDQRAAQPHLQFTRKTDRRQRIQPIGANGLTDVDLVGIELQFSGNLNRQPFLRRSNSRKRFSDPSGEVTQWNVRAQRNNRERRQGGSVRRATGLA